MTNLSESLGLNPSLEFESNDTSYDNSSSGNQTYFAPYEVPVEIVVLLSLFYGAISLVAVLGKVLTIPLPVSDTLVIHSQALHKSS